MIHNKKTFLFILSISIVIIISSAVTATKISGKEPDFSTTQTETSEHLLEEIKVPQQRAANNLINAHPKWKETSKMSLSEAESFKLQYSTQIEIKNNINFVVSDNFLVFTPSQKGDKAEIFLTNVGEYGTTIVNMKVSVESLNGLPVKLGKSATNFMNWILEGNASVKIKYEYFNSNGDSITVSGINYFKGLNAAKDVLYKDSDLAYIFSNQATNVLYEDSNLAGFTRFFSNVSGWSDSQILGIVFKNKSILEFALKNNDSDSSQVAYSSEAPIKIIDSPMIDKHPKWLDSSNSVIPKQNYFTMYYSDKIKVSKQSGDVTIQNDAVNGYNANFTSSSPASILIENVGFYEGQWISLSVTASGKASGSASVSSSLEITKDVFLRWALQGNVMLNTEYQFLNSKKEPIAISGYWTFKNLNSAKSLALSSNFVKNIYAPSKTDIRYNIFGNLTEFSSKLEGGGTTKEMTVTFDNISDFKFSIRNNDPDESAVVYGTTALSAIVIPDFIPENKKYERIASETKLFTSFRQMIPYEPEHGRKNSLKWEIKLPDYIQKNNTIGIFNEAGNDSSSLFTVSKEDGNLTIKANATSLSSADFYNHLYEFRINWQINYVNPINVELLDSQGYLHLISSMDLQVDQEDIRKNEDRTVVNFNSDTEVLFQDIEGKELQRKQLKSFITLKPTDLETQLKEKIVGYKFMETTIDINNYQSKYTNNAIETVSSKKIAAPIITLKDPEKIRYIKLEDKHFDLTGEIKLDGEASYEIHLLVHDKDEIIQSSVMNTEGSFAWQTDAGYHVSNLPLGKSYDAEVYAKDEFGNQSNKVPFKIFMGGHLEVKEVPVAIDFGVHTLTSKAKIMARKTPYTIKISDLRGPNERFKLELKLDEYLTGKEYNQVIKDGIVFKDTKGSINYLEKGETVFIASGNTGNENKETETVIQHDVNSGILVNLVPGIKKDIYSTKLTWTLVDGP